MSWGPQVLITDAEQRSVLAACRGLAAAGYRVSTVAEERCAVGHWSRFSNERITLPGPKADPEGYVERLSQVLRRRRYDMVMPGAEQSMLPISERRDLIEPYTHLGLPPHKIVLRALNKPLLQSKAAAVGLAPPESIICSNHEEALEAARRFKFPLVVKPARSLARTAGHTQHLKKVCVVRDASLFEDTVASVGIPLIVQEYISEPTIVSCAGVRANNQLLGATLAQYARTYPPQSGDAAMATTIAPPSPLIQQVEKLLELIGWCGIFELELLKLGENHFGAIDLNPRPFGWMGLAVGAGANLPAIWCDHVLGRHSVSPNVARVGVNYRWEEGDILHALTQLRHGYIRSTMVRLRPHRLAVHAHFRIDDPVPLFARICSLVAKKVKQPPRWRSIRGGTYT